MMAGGAGELRYKAYGHSGWQTVGSDRQQGSGRRGQTEMEAVLVQAMKSRAAYVDSLMESDVGKNVPKSQFIVGWKRKRTLTDPLTKRLQTC